MKATARDDATAVSRLTYNKAFGPRLGIAYQITPKTIFRGGWGLTYGTRPTSRTSAIPRFSAADPSATTRFRLSRRASARRPPLSRQGLPYTQAQLYPTTLSAGIVPFTGQLNSPPYWIDPQGGRPPRINQWNIGIQRSITADLVVEAAYVGNRGVWLQATTLEDLNGLTTQRLSQFGLNLNNAANQTLLKSTFASGLPQAAGFALPYAGFPLTSTLAQALRPFPQFTNIKVLWDPRGNAWYDSLQAKVTQRLKHGLNAQFAFTWQKELTTAEGTNVNDVYNLPVQKAISPSSLPLWASSLSVTRFPRCRFRTRW